MSDTQLPPHHRRPYWPWLALVAVLVLVGDFGVVLEGQIVTPLERGS